MTNENTKENIVVLQKNITLPDGYKPSEDEEYMCDLHLEYFRQKLLLWKSELLKDFVETLHHLQEETHNEPDVADRASAETDRTIELRTRDRGRKLINKIDDALMRIEDGTYGYCEEAGDAIGLPRLEARPIATLSLEAQERHEKEERVHRDD